MNRAVLCSIAARGRRFNQVWMVKPHKLEVWRDKVNRRLKEDLTKPVTHRKREKEAREEKEGWPWNDGHMADHAAKLIRKEVLGYGVRKTHAKITELLVELKRLERLGCTMGPKTFNVLVKHAFGQHDLVTMKVLWEDIAARGLPVSQFVWGKILFFHVTMRDIGALKTAWKTYLRIDGNREALLGTYINALAKAGCREEAFSLFRGIVGPSKGNYHAVLPACSSYQEAKELIGEMENTVGTDLKTYTELIELLAKLKNPQMAQKVFDKVTKVIEPDSLCRDALLRAYADSADLPGLLSAIKIFEARSTTTSRTPIFIVTTCTACLDLPDPDVPYLRSLVHATYHNYRYKCKHKDQFRLIAFTHRFYHKLSPDEGTTFKRAAKLEMDNRDRHSSPMQHGLGRRYRSAAVTVVLVSLCVGCSGDCSKWEDPKNSGPYPLWHYCKRRAGSGETLYPYMEASLRPAEVAPYDCRAEGRVLRHDAAGIICADYTLGDEYGGPCTTAQCCAEGLCSSYVCKGGGQLKAKAGEISCAYFPCNDHLCCEGPSGSPKEEARGLVFVDRDPGRFSFGGKGTLLRAADEADITHYRIYWGFAKTVRKVPSCGLKNPISWEQHKWTDEKRLFLELPVTGCDIDFEVPMGTVPWERCPIATDRKDKTTSANDPCNPHYLVAVSVNGKGERSFDGQAQQIGPRHPISDYEGEFGLPCAEGGVTYGHDLPGPDDVILGSWNGVESAARCAELCRGYSSKSKGPCRYWVWGYPTGGHTAKSCWMETQLLQKAHYGVRVAGPAVCPTRDGERPTGRERPRCDRWVRIPNTAAWKNPDTTAGRNAFFDKGGAFMQKPNLPDVPLGPYDNAEECQAMCDMDPLCVGFTWMKRDPTDTYFHKCFLIRVDDGTRASTDFYDLWLCSREGMAPLLSGYELLSHPFGYKTCGEGPPSSSEAASDHDCCAQKCNDNKPSCAAFTFRHTDKICELHSACSDASLRSHDKVEGCAYESCFQGYGLATYRRLVPTMQIVDRWPVVGGQGGVPAFVQTTHIPEGTDVHCVINEKGKSIPSSAANMLAVRHFTGKVSASDGVASMVLTHVTDTESVKAAESYVMRCAADDMAGFGLPAYVEHSFESEVPFGFVEIRARNGDTGYCRGPNNCLNGYVADTKKKPYSLEACRKISYGDSKSIAFLYRAHDGHCGIVTPKKGCTYMTTVQADDKVRCYNKQWDTVHSIGKGECTAECPGTCSWKRQFGAYERNIFSPTRAAPCSQIEVPTTSPKTSAPETPAPDTTAPETKPPATRAPETVAPDTRSPDTRSPETPAPDTKPPETTAPETAAPRTSEPTAEPTRSPETTAPETAAPLTPAPRTSEPTAEPTGSPLTAQPTTEPTTEQTTAPRTEAPDTEAPETKVPDTEAPETSVPDTKPPETREPTAEPTGSPLTAQPTTTEQTTAPRTEAPDTLAPDTKAPDTLAPDTKAPDTLAPDTKAPDTAEPTRTPSQAPTTAVPTALPTGVPGGARERISVQVILDVVFSVLDAARRGELEEFLLGHLLRWVATLQKVRILYACEADQAGERVVATCVDWDGVWSGNGRTAAITEGGLTYVHVLGEVDAVDLEERREEMKAATVVNTGVGGGYIIVEPRQPVEVTLCAEVVCDIEGPCRGKGVCDEGTGTCSSVVLSNGTLCDDGSSSTMEDRCSGGVCVGRLLGCGASWCEASRPECHVPVCVDGVCGEESKPDGSACNDGNTLTTSDVCTKGTCSGVFRCELTTCPSQPCRVSRCNPFTSLCSYSFSQDGTPCDDGDSGTVGDLCRDSVCVSGNRNETTGTRAGSSGSDNTVLMVAVAVSCAVLCCCLVAGVLLRKRRNDKKKMPKEVSKPEAAKDSSDVEMPVQGERWERRKPSLHGMPFADTFKERKSSVHGMPFADTFKGRRSSEHGMPFADTVKWGTEDRRPSLHGMPFADTVKGLQDLEGRRSSVHGKPFADTVNVASLGDICDMELASDSDTCHTYTEKLETSSYTDTEPSGDMMEATV